MPEIQELAPVDRRQMTLMLSDKEMTVLDQLSQRRGMSKTALVRQALRLYQSVTERLENGEKVFVEKPATKEKTELMVL
jgi:Ribbon-helix-helix protein, copG family